MIDGTGMKNTANQGRETNDKPVTRRGFMAGAATVGVATAIGTRVHGSMLANQDASTAQEEVALTDNENEITDQTLIEAAKISALSFTTAERKMMLPGLKRAAQGYRERRKQSLPNGLLPAHIFDPRLPGMSFDTEQKQFHTSTDDPGPLPDNDEDIAYAPLTKLSRWIENKLLTSERLTNIYINRLKKYGPVLECVITLTGDLALKQARQADREIKAGKYRGPLHGIPYGAKDLFDTKGIRTTWGATPYKDRVADSDAAVIQKLNNAGAVLVAKTTLGALAYGDIWFGGKTRNPFNLKQGSSGSSAGSAAGVSAGLFAFALGTETLGSIVSPSMRCGATGLRPTFGRVARTGAMALCWSLDKVGVLARTAEDDLLVLNVIRGKDPGDAASHDMPLNFNATQPVKNYRVGYVPAWFESRRATDIDRACLNAAKNSGMQLAPIEFPDLPYGELITILNVEAAAAFEELTLTNRDDELVWQDPEAWPNSFRQSWFVPAIELIQAERFRRQVCEMMAEQFTNLNAMIGPSYAGGMLLITNNTGHPCITIRAGFRSNNRPHGFTIWGRLYDEGTMCRIAMELEKQLNVWQTRPTMNG